MLRGDTDESFFTYGFDASKLLYASSKQPTPNVFTGAAFKPHITEMLEMRLREISSKKSFSYPA